MRVEVFDLFSRKQFSSNTNDIAFSLDFNRIEVDGARPDFVEAELGKWEGQISRSIKDIVSSRSLSDPRHLEDVVLLASMLSIRTPRFRQIVKKTQIDIYKLTVEYLLSSRDRWEEAARIASARQSSGLNNEAHYEDVRRLYDRGSFEIDAEIQTGYYVQKEFSILPKISELMMQRNWGLLYAPPETGGFITSDHPLVVTWTKPLSSHYGPGLGLRNTSVIMPLSPSLTLVGRFESVPRFETLGPGQVARLNGRAAYHAERQVFARDMNFYYVLSNHEQPRKASKLIEEQLGHRAR
jgi:hypothetical protein